MRANFDNNRGGKFVLSSKTHINKDFFNLAGCVPKSCGTKKCAIVTHFIDTTGTLDTLGTVCSKLFFKIFPVIFKPGIVPQQRLPIVFGKVINHWAFFYKRRLAA